MNWVGFKLKFVKLSKYFVKYGNLEMLCNRKERKREKGEGRRERKPSISVQDPTPKS